MPTLNKKTGSSPVFVKTYGCVHPAFNIGLADLRTAWLLEAEPISLHVTVYRGQLTYRQPKTRKRISYRQLKNGLVKTTRTRKQPLPLLPF